LYILLAGVPDVAGVGRVHAAVCFGVAKTDRRKDRQTDGQFTIP